MFKKLLIILFAAFLLTGCSDNLYPTIDEIPPDEETVTDEEIVDEDVIDEEDEGSDNTDEEEPADDTDPDEDEPADDTEPEEEEEVDDTEANENVDEEDVTEEETSGTTKSEDEQSCVFSSECPEDRDLCFEGECSTLDEVFEKYTDCGSESDSEFNCPESCEGCKDGKLSCLTILNGDYDFKICADCATSYSCEEGYECDSLKHKCIPNE